MPKKNKTVGPMSYTNRQARFRQEKTELIKNKPYLKGTEMDAAIKALAAKWRV